MGEPYGSSGPTPRGPQESGLNAGSVSSWLEHVCPVARQPGCSDHSRLLGEALYVDPTFSSESGDMSAAQCKGLPWKNSAVCLGNFMSHQNVLGTLG